MNAIKQTYPLYAEAGLMHSILPQYIYQTFPDTLNLQNPLSAVLKHDIELTNFIEMFPNVNISKLGPITKYEIAVKNIENCRKLNEGFTIASLSMCQYSRLNTEQNCIVVEVNTERDPDWKINNSLWGIALIALGNHIPSCIPMFKTVLQHNIDEIYRVLYSRLLARHSKFKVGQFNYVDLKNAVCKNSASWFKCIKSNTEKETRQCVETAIDLVECDFNLDKIKLLPKLNLAIYNVDVLQCVNQLFKTPVRSPFNPPSPHLFKYLDDIECIEKQKIESNVAKIQLKTENHKYLDNLFTITKHPIERNKQPIFVIQGWCQPEFNANFQNFISRDWFEEWSIYSNLK